ncbi:NAD(P)-binding protein [Flagelloscypha sp. PMI_526]|nr:NAD(P)-binding protein [Flagelloscypha sp. PMI_526]
MRVLILGSTSPTGHHIITKYFEKYPQGTAVLYARTPSKLPSSISSNPSVTVVEGQLVDLNKLETCFQGETVDTVLSTLGPTAFRFKGTPIADFYQTLIRTMSKNGCKRLIVLSTPSFPDPHDKFKLGAWLMILLVRAVAGNAYREMRAIPSAVQKEGDANGIDWTVGRVLLLTNKSSVQYKHIVSGYVGDGKTSMFISREAIAEWWIGQVESNEWAGKHPYISN